MGREGKGTYLKDRGASNAELLLHPELLSQDFIQLVLKEKNITTGDDGGRDRLTDLYLRHVIPLPQRALPNNRWGRRMERARARQNTPSGLSCRWGDGKRPQIVFDASPSKSVPVRLKTPQGHPSSSGVTDRLKPPPSTNPLRKLSSTAVTSTSSSPVFAGSQRNTCLGRPSPTSVHLKREADSLV
uniref:Ashwin n=1 Tax=Esox lucius TaxID=8010 RepID=A0A3P9AHB0_ESOLU